MPFPNEHAARINDPGKYIRVRRQNDRFGPGIHAIFGVLRRDGEEVTEIQSLRFDRDRFTVAQAKKWLKDHGFEAKQFEPATGEAMYEIFVPIDLGEGKWQQILYTGKFEHPRFGKFEITKKDLENAVEVFESGAQGREIQTNFQHASQDTDPEKAKASGWIQKLKVVGNRLLALWKPTEMAKEFVKRGEFKYISPEFHHDWKDENGEKRGFTILGFALTNRNFLKKGAIPVMLTEHGYRVADDVRGYEYVSDEGESVSLLHDWSSGNVTVLYKGSPVITHNVETWLQDFTTAEWDGGAVRTRLDQEDLIKVIPPAAARYVRQVASQRDISVSEVPKALFYFPVKATPDGPINVNALRAVLGGRGAQADIPEPFKTEARDWARKQFEKWRESVQTSDLEGQALVAEIEKEIETSGRSGARTQTGENDMKLSQDVMELLGLSEGFTDEQFEAGIKRLAEASKAAEGGRTLTEEEYTQLMAVKSENEALKARVEAGERAEKKLKEMRRDQLIQKALSDGKLTAAEVQMNDDGTPTETAAFWMELAENKPEQFKAIVDARPKHPDFTEIGGDGHEGGSKDPVDRYMKRLKDVSKEHNLDTVSAMKWIEQNEPDTHKAYRQAMEGEV